MNFLNKPAQPLLSNTVSKKATMKELAALSMPTEMNAMLALIDDVIANSMQHINASLQQSNAQVDAAKKRLLEQHTGLEQAYDSSIVHGSEEQYDAYGPQNKESQTHPQTLLQEVTTPKITQQESVQKEQHKIAAMLESSQESINKAATTIENKLATRQKNYESRIAATNLKVMQQSIAANNQATAKAESIENISAEEMLQKEEKTSEDGIKHIVDQASNIHKQAADIIASTGQNASALIAHPQTGTIDQEPQ